PLLLLIVLAPGSRGFLFETETLETVFVLLFAGRVLSSFSEIFTLILVARERVIQQSAVLVATRGVRLLATLLVLVWAPEITLMSALFAARSPERDREARALFYSGMDKLLFVATPIGATIWLAADPIIAGFFGAAFLPAAAAVHVFVLANLVATVTNNYTQVLYAVEAHGRLVPVVPPRAALYFVLLMVLVPAEPLGGWIPTL